MPKPMKIGYQALVESARREIEELTSEQLQEMLEQGDVLVVDVRERREIERDGRIPGSFNCPRGVLEFWIDPASPYFKSEFGHSRHYVFYCSLDWRSALSTQTAQRMGLENVMNLKGGFKAWKEVGGPVEMLDKVEMADKSA
jgi:rhodanese-related sulfurtransferase